MLFLEALTPTTPSRSWRIPVPVVLSSRCVSLQVCVVLCLLQTVKQSNFLLNLTSVKVLILPSTSWVLVVHVNRFLIQRLELLTLVTLHVVLLTFLRTLLLLKKSVIQLRVLGFLKTLTLRKATYLKHLQIELLVDILLAKSFILKQVLLSLAMMR